MSSFAMARARRALQAAMLDIDMPLEPASSVTNEVWLAPDYVIRVNRRLDPRLRREAALAPHLPEAVQYPEIVAYGGRPGSDWLIMRRVTGQVLSRTWPGMSGIQRREAIHQLAGALQALHSTPVPAELPEIDAAVPQLLSGRTFSPVMPLLVAIDKLRAHPAIPRELLERAEQVVHDCEHAVSPHDTSHLIHGDLTFENVMWDGEKITALLDFEWARPGPADLDLDVLLRFCALPQLHVAADYEHLVDAESFDQVPGWLAEDYPELFGFPNQYERLVVYAIAYDVRDLLENPPTAAAEKLPRHHAVHRLTYTLNGRSYLRSLSLSMS